VDKNKDPLANQDLILHDVKNLGRDGIGASWANFHGAVFRVDVLKSGKDSKVRVCLCLCSDSSCPACLGQERGVYGVVREGLSVWCVRGDVVQGNQVVPEDKLKEHVGKDVGFSTFTVRRTPPRSV
jgi:hypothetical protein